MFSRTLYAQHPVTKDVPISTRFILSPCKFSTLQCTVFYPPGAKSMHPIDYKLYACDKKCLTVLHSTAAPLIIEYEGVSTCIPRMYPYTQNPALETVHQQSLKVYLYMYKTGMLNVEYSAKPSMCSMYH